VFVVLSMSAGKVRLEQKLGGRRAVRDLEGIHFQPQPKAQAQKSQVRVVNVEDLGDAEVFLARIRVAARPVKGKDPAR
jgi:hypothetical protein